MGKIIKQAYLFKTSFFREKDKYVLFQNLTLR